MEFKQCLTVHKMTEEQSTIAPTPDPQLSTVERQIPGIMEPQTLTSELQTPVLQTPIIGPQIPTVEPETFASQPQPESLKPQVEGEQHHLRLQRLIKSLICL